MSFVGFFTGGLLKVFILVWNGFLFAMIYNSVIYTVPLETILYSSKHVFFELFAFLLFAEFGFKGFQFVKNIISNNEINFNHMPSLYKLILPGVLLLFSAFLEVI